MVKMEKDEELIKDVHDLHQVYKVEKWQHWRVKDFQQLLLADSVLASQKKKKGTRKKAPRE